MPSLADIPEDLIHADKWPDFIEWLRQTHADPKVRAELGRLWAAETMEPLTKPRWQQLMPTPPPTPIHGPQ